MKLVCLECGQKNEFLVDVVTIVTELYNGEGEFVRNKDDDGDTQDVRCGNCESHRVVDAEKVIKCPSNIILSATGQSWFAVESLENLEKEVVSETQGYFASDYLTFDEAIKALEKQSTLVVIYKDWQDYEMYKEIVTTMEFEELLGNAKIEENDTECYYIIFNKSDMKAVKEIKKSFSESELPKENSDFELICLNCGKSEGFESDLQVTKSVALDSKGNVQHTAYSEEDEFSVDLKCIDCGSSEVYNAKSICESVDCDMLVSLDCNWFSDVGDKQEFEEFFTNEKTFIPSDSALTMKQAFDELKSGNGIVAATITDEGDHKLKWIKQLKDLQSILDYAYPKHRSHTSLHRINDIKPISILQEKYKSEQ